MIAATALQLAVPDSGVIAGVALLLTAVVGVFSYRASQKSNKNLESIGGANTAIHGLEVLAAQHAAEIARLDKRYAECETGRLQALERIAILDGQIDVLKFMASGAAAEAVRAAAAGAKDAVDTAKSDAKAAVDAARHDAQTAVDTAAADVKKGRRNGD